MRNFTYFLAAGVVVISAIIFPSFLVAAQESTSDVSISVRRMNYLPAGDYVEISAESLNSSPILIDAIIQADKKYETFADWCNSKEYNCFYSSYSKLLDYTYTVTVPSTEVKSSFDHLNLKELEVAERPAGSYYGLKILHDGKFYNVVISNIGK